MDEPRLAEVERIAESLARIDSMQWVVGDERMTGPDIMRALVTEVRRLRDPSHAWGDGQAVYQRKDGITACGCHGLPEKKA